jgi:hypothetical protein
MILMIKLLIKYTIKIEKKAMRQLLFFALGLSLLSSFTASNPKPFIAMQGEKLDGTLLNLPTDFKGKASLLVLAYSQKAEKDLATWQSPLYLKFIAKPKSTDVFAFSGYDINLLFVPMFTGVNQTAEGQATKKMKAEIEPSMQQYFMVFKGDVKPFKADLGMVNKDEPYLFVLDKNGNIVYQTSGAFTKEKMDGIEDHIEE